MVDRPCIPGIVSLSAYMCLYSKKRCEAPSNGHLIKGSPILSQYTSNSHDRFGVPFIQENMHFHTRGAGLQLTSTHVTIFKYYNSPYISTNHKAEA